MAEISIRIADVIEMHSVRAFCRKFRKRVHHKFRIPGMGRTQPPPVHPPLSVDLHTSFCAQTVERFGVGMSAHVKAHHPRMEFEAVLSCGSAAEFERIFLAI